jgi:hypothetical protein
MSSNPGLDDDDDILLIPVEAATDKDPPPVSSSISAVYPRWSENPNRLPIAVTPRPVATQPIPAAWTIQGLELQAAASPARRTVIQMPGGQIGGLSESPVSFTWAYVASCVVYWCFCLVLGSVAYGIAAMGENHAYEGQIAKAQFWRNVSYATSGAGVILGIILMVLIFTVILPTYGKGRV